MKELSDFLTYRDLPYNDFYDRYCLGISGGGPLHPVRDGNDLDEAIKKSLANLDWDKTGILLSGGIDSALLASYCPKGALAFTIVYPELGGVDESRQARLYAYAFGLNLVEVPVTWEDILLYQDVLMRFRKEPLQAIEASIHKMCLRAKEMCLESLIAGIGSDVRFGGLTRMMSRDWTKEEFIKAYSFMEPDLILRSPENPDLSLFDRFEKDGVFDGDAFMADGYGRQTAKAFVTDSLAAGIGLIAPYETMERKFELNRKEIGGGNEKKILRDLFREKTGLEAPRKYPLPRPLQVWKEHYGPIINKDEFYEDAYERCRSDEQRWIVYTLDHWLSLYKGGLLG